MGKGYFGHRPTEDKAGNNLGDYVPGAGWTGDILSKQQEENRKKEEKIQKLAKNWMNSR